MPVLELALFCVQGGKPYLLSFCPRHPLLNRRWSPW